MGWASHGPPSLATPPSSLLSRMATWEKSVPVELRLPENPHGREKVNEVARMLAGEKITELSIKHAEEMVHMAEKN